MASSKIKRKILLFAVLELATLDDKRVNFYDVASHRNITEVGKQMFVLGCQSFSDV